MKKLLLFGVMLLFIPTFVFADDVEVSLSKCVDGDTAKFEFKNGDIITYRFLAIDTPETVHPTKEIEAYGKEASEYTCNRLTNAKKIVLEHDDKAGNTDKYGRGLAWVFVDDSLLQEELVERGLAEVAYLYGNYKYNDLLKDTEVVAKTLKVGMWGDSSELDDTINNASSITTSVDDSNDGGSWIDRIIDYIIDKIVASISNFIDSLLKEFES